MKNPKIERFRVWRGKVVHHVASVSWGSPYPQLRAPCGARETVANAVEQETGPAVTCRKCIRLAAPAPQLPTGERNN